VSIVYIRSASVESIADYTQACSEEDYTPCTISATDTPYHIDGPSHNNLQHAIIQRTSFLSLLSHPAPLTISKSTVLLYFLAIFVPFVAVFLRRGCKADLFINVLLCILGWIPGIIHAWYIISQMERNPKSMGRPDGRRY